MAERDAPRAGDGLLASLADGNGNTLTCKYDGLKRLAQVIYPDSTYGAVSYHLTDSLGSVIGLVINAGGRARKALERRLTGGDVHARLRAPSIMSG